MIAIFLRRVFAVWVGAAMLAAMAAADGTVLRRPAVLYDSHSERATPLLILSAGYPLREVSRVDGWRKVLLLTGESGWVRERFVRDARAAIVAVEITAARSSPSVSSPEVFYARRGVVLEVLRETGGWLELLHSDGETGYAPAADLWTNF